MGYPLSRLLKLELGNRGITFNVAYSTFYGFFFIQWICIYLERYIYFFLSTLSDLSVK